MAADSGDPDGFITLPPGIVDSGTFKRSTPKVERTPKPALDDVVFFPAPPGVAPVVRPPAPPAEPGFAAPPAEPAAASLDEATRISTSRHAAPSWRLVLPDGAEPMTLDSAVFIGRNPSATPERAAARLLSVQDTTKTVSKTHALLELDAGQLWVHDLNSTNGVFVAAPGQDVVEVEPGTRAQVPPGSDLELGDFVIQVELG